MQQCRDMDISVFLRGVNQKSESAWKELYRYYYASLCSYADRLTGETGLGEDVVQDCLVRMWKMPLEFSDLKALTAWLYKSVYNASISVLREKKSQERLYNQLSWAESVDENGAQNMALREEAISRFYEVLYKLPRQQQDVLLFSLRGLSVSEVAKEMGITENTVKTLKKRAYLFVREHLESRYLYVLLFLLFGK